MTNTQLAQLLRKIAAAYEILGENRFKIIAYERAADSIEHLTQDAKDVWEQGKLSEIPGIGKGIEASLHELFSTGKVRHYEDVLGNLPESLYPLLLVPGIGPKRAYTLVTKLQLKDPKTVISDLEKAIKENRIAHLDGFGERSQEQILENIQIFKQGQIKENRMLLSAADDIAGELIAYMKQCRLCLRVDPLGSLRRRVATVGDVDISVSTKHPKEVIDHFLTFPHKKIIDQGPAGSTILLYNGIQVDLRVQEPETYGSMLQYFTGSKHHNITLRTFALGQGKSLSEHGIKDVKTGKLTQYSSEEEYYKALGLPYIAPELREDMGEIEAAQKNRLPALVEPQDIAGDLHVHTNYEFPVSHDLGSSHIHEYLDRAEDLGYEYIGFSDHNPKIGGLSPQERTRIMNKRYTWYRHEADIWNKKHTRHMNIFVMCEVDILHDGTVALPVEAFDYIDGAIVSIHSSFRQDKSTMTKRILSALTAHPKVRIFGHPTGRIINARDGIDADWQEIFRVCKNRDIALEINAYPDRLDLPDQLVFDAVRSGIKLCIDTDSHVVDQLDLLHYGVSVARRGWAERGDIVNTLKYTKFSAWLKHA